MFGRMVLLLTTAADTLPAMVPEQCVPWPAKASYSKSLAVSPSPSKNAMYCTTFDRHSYGPLVH